MKTIVPDYYPEFHCIAGACRHSCCIGWEIDIDEDTRQLYREIPGEIGRRLSEQIDDSGEVPCFSLDERERCPFLNGDGLCDIILQLGEGALCQICADHPRFRSFFSDRTEMGLGLCCEAAADLILRRTELRGSALCAPGALLSAAGWILFSYLYSIYTRFFPRSSHLYGSMATLVILMLWLYFCMIIFLCGAEVNKLLTDWTLQRRR